jgi:hypothetical protein
MLHRIFKIILILFIIYSILYLTQYTPIFQQSLLLTTLITFINFIYPTI